MISIVPNVLYIVWDDAGIGAWNAFGGLVETPAMRWLAARGLRYSRWHTPARAEATRSSLLTGRHRESVPPEVATLAEILAGGGYRAYCVGQWGLAPAGAGAMASSRGTWPLARGFDRYYGFLGRQTSPWYPDLVYDDQQVDPPYAPAEGYHLSRDLADMAIELIRDGMRADPGRPWLCYLSFGATGVPHVAPREWTEDFRGRFEMGYDRYREIVLGNMKRLGLVPEETALGAAGGPRPGAAGGGAVRPWHALTEPQKRLGHLLAESAASLGTYTDRQVGRLLGYLAESGQLEDTLVVACSANAARADDPGGLASAANESGLLAGWPGPARAGAAPGDPAGDDAVAAGWIRAFGAPYHRGGPHWPGGGEASPLIITWPRQMADVAGGVRDQYHRAVDVVPTILDCAGVGPPRRAGASAQAPLPGVSMRYTFTAPDAPSPRPAPVYRIRGARVRPPAAPATVHGSRAERREVARPRFTGRGLSGGKRPGRGSRVAG